MTSISIIGVGSMAKALATRALAGGNAVEVIGRDPAKAEALRAALGDGATVGAPGAVPVGDVVVLAVLHDGAAAVVRDYGDALRGKVLVDITNPVTADASGLVPEDRSGALAIAAAAPAGAHVVKAFNTIFSGVLAAAPTAGSPLDVFLAGDDAEAKALVSTFVESLGMRPLDAGPLPMARSLEHTGLMMIGLIRHSVGNAGFSLGVRTAG
jgi:8-hydroxy-5-deazaflavin:NADPH oxidoreductase